MQIKWNTATERYEAATKYEDRHAIKAAGGFRWSPAEKIWTTIFPEGPLKLIPHLDAVAAERLRAHCAHKVEKLRASALSASDFAVWAPEGLAYRPFQSAGVQFIAANNGRALLGDEMGLGKTIQALGYVNHAEIETTIVVCPATLRGNWSREATKWTPETVSVDVLEGRGKSVRSVREGTSSRRIVIVGYDTVKNWQDQLVELAGESTLIVLDECHRIKNKKAQRTVAVKAVAGKCGRVLCMTGTPIVNRPIELWEIISLIDPQTFDNFFAFAKRYAGAHKEMVPVRGKGMRSVWNFSGATNLDELQEKLRTSIMIRRTKDQVLAELPAKQHTIVELKPSKAIREFEAAVSKQLGVDVTNRRAMADALAGIEGQIVGFEDMSRLRELVGRSKVGEIAEYLDLLLETEESVILFAHHKAVLAALRDHCVEAGYGAAMITGDTPPNLRDAEVDRFQNGEVRVFLGAITAAGEGITLTRASQVILAELDWRPGMMQQAEDRAHRIGQRDVVFCHYLVAGGVEGHIANTIADKVQIIDAAVGADATATDPAITALEDKIRQLSERIAELRKPQPAKSEPEATEPAELADLDLDVVPF